MIMMTFRGNAAHKTNQSKLKQNVVIERETELYVLKVGRFYESITDTDSGFDFQRAKILSFSCRANSFCEAHST